MGPKKGKKKQDENAAGSSQQTGQPGPAGGPSQGAQPSRGPPPRFSGQPRGPPPGTGGPSPGTSGPFRGPPSGMSGPSRGPPSLMSLPSRGPPPGMSGPPRGPPPGFSGPQRGPPPGFSGPQRGPPPGSSESQRGPPPALSESQRGPPPGAPPATVGVPPRGIPASQPASSAETQPEPQRHGGEKKDKRKGGGRTDVESTAKSLEQLKLSSEAGPSSEGGQEGQSAGKKKKKKGQADKKHEPSIDITSQVQAVVPSPPSDVPPTKSLPKPAAVRINIPLRKGQEGGKEGPRTLIEVNYLELKFNKPNANMYHYDVAFARQKRQFKTEAERWGEIKAGNLLRKALDEVRIQNYPNNYPGFDGRKNMYSCGPIKFVHGGDGVTETVVIRDDQREEDLTVRVTVKEVGVIPLKTVLDYMKKGSSVVLPQDSLQAVDIALRNRPMTTREMYGRSFFNMETGRGGDLGCGLDLYIGHFQSAVLASKPYLNIDVSHKAVPRACNILDLKDDFFRSRCNLTDLNKYVKGLNVVTGGVGTVPRRVHKVNSVTDDRSCNADSFKFKLENGSETNITRYYWDHYRYKIKYPKESLVLVEPASKKTLIPAELVNILGNQNYKKKLTPDQTSKMVKAAARPTFERKDRIMKVISEIKFDLDPCLKEFGITVEKTFSRIFARTLEKPLIQYNGGVDTPRFGVWRGVGKYLECGSVRNWIIISYSSKFKEREAWGLNDALKRTAAGVGFANFGDFGGLFTGNDRDVRNSFQSCIRDAKAKLKGDLDLVCVILSDYNSDCYSQVKQAAEVHNSVLTQCLKFNTLLSPKGAFNAMTMGNIMLKINAKLNGTNHRLADRSLPKIMRENYCMIMGADVTHPSPDQTDIPSIACVSASHDRFGFKYNKKINIQNPREEIIQNLAEIVKAQLILYRSKTGQPPRKIIIYRDGVSEGQYEQVLREELTEIKKAFGKLSPNYSPDVTFIVVQKRHHTRFFPTDARRQCAERDRNENLPAGTIVDTDIVHPTEIEYYLLSHAGIQGTSRPTKYHVLHDDSKMTMDEIEQLSYYLCYMYARCNRSVSYPAPTYYAHLGAFRGRHLITGVNIDVTKCDAANERNAITKILEDSNPMHFV